MATRECTDRQMDLIPLKEFRKRVQKKSSKPSKLQNTTCLNCSFIFDYSPKNRRGKFCSIKCTLDYNWRHHKVPIILNGTCKSKSAMKRYLRESRGDKCQECNSPPVHNGKSLVLQLDHVNGDSDDNTLVNLRLLCPNCHSQTDTYCGRQKGKIPLKVTRRNIYKREYDRKP